MQFFLLLVYMSKSIFVSSDTLCFTLPRIMIQLLFTYTLDSVQNSLVASFWAITMRERDRQWVGKRLNTKSHIVPSSLYFPSSIISNTKTTISVACNWEKLRVEDWLQCKASNGSGGISFAGSSTVGGITLFHYKIVLVPDLAQLNYC